jgi:opacity protein-like surface antigen
VGLGSGTWAIPYYLDVGTGSSALTWQAMAGIEYRFRWGDVQLSYRYLYYDMKDDEMLKGVSFSGPGLGVNFRF